MARTSTEGRTIALTATLTVVGLVAVTLAPAIADATGLRLPFWVLSLPTALAATAVGLVLVLDGRQRSVGIGIVVGALATIVGLLALVFIVVLPSLE